MRLHVPDADQLVRPDVAQLGFGATGSQRLGSAVLGTSVDIRTSAFSYNTNIKKLKIVFKNKFGVPCCFPLQSEFKSMWSILGSLIVGEVRFEDSWGSANSLFGLR